MPIDCGTHTADLWTVKLLLNSMISTPGAKLTTLDLKDFYLNTPVERLEFLRIKIDHFPQDVVKHYSLNDLVYDNGYLMVSMQKGMDGLPHAVIIAQQLLKKCLKDKGYHQIKTTPGYWKHEWHPISFSLAVDDFGVKYVGEQHANHLLSVLREFYVVDKNENGDKYCDINLDWDYGKVKVHFSMPGYFSETLQCFRLDSARWTEQLHGHNIPVYRAKIQWVKKLDYSPKIGPTDKLFIQQVTGTFLYYARAVDSTTLVALSTIVAQ